MRELTEWMHAARATSIVTIDGPSGAGKSTFARQLHALHPQWHIIHLDDVYRDWDDLLPTVDIMRAQLVEPLLDGHFGVWPKWTWPRTGPIEPTIMPAGSRIIIEGSGSTAMVPIGSTAARHVWIDTPATIRSERIRQRDGSQFDEHWPTWFAHWETYLQRYRPQERCEVIPG